MRRARRKRNFSKYKFLYFQTAVGILLILLYIIGNAPDLIVMIHEAKVLPLLKMMIGIIVAYVAGPLIVIYLVRSAILQHKGITSVNWRTYLNDSLYNDFCSQPSDIDPNDIRYWKTQEIITRKREEQGGGMEYITNRKSLDPETVDAILDGKARPGDQADSIPEGDPLEGLPEFDPNGPDPFKRR
jgi:uncharacterized integral membrane protein